MSEEKPISPLKSNVFGHAPTTKTIRYKVEDANGNKHDITETIDISLNGNTGLTKTIRARLNNGQAVPDLTQLAALERGGEEIDLLDLAQNSSNRDEAYKKMMKKVESDAEKNGKSVEFNNALVENGTYNAVNDVGGESINDTPIVSETTRNNETIKNDIDTNNAELENFEDSIQVENVELYYPIDMITEVDNSQDYIYIEQYSYQPPQPVGTGKNPPSDVIKRGVTRAQNINIEERHGGCKLPIPNKLGVSNGVNWGEARANALELAAFDSASGAIANTLKEPGKILQAVTGGLAETGKTLQALRDDIQQSRSDPNAINTGTILSGVLARSALGTIGINVDIDQFITRQTGAAINPNLELLFGGPQLRSFNFAFNFAPNSTTEARMVRKIQRWFKQGMLPSRKRATASAESSLFLASPNVFRIAYKNHNRRIKGLNMFKICALTSVQIDFTPDGVFNSYEDSKAISMPVRSTMGLSFTELTPIFKDDYDPKSEDPSMIDAGLNASGANAIDENDIGF